jgi:transposase
LYRQSIIYARDGVELSCSTLADWVGQCSALVRPLVETIRQYVMSGKNIHTDDTPVRVLEPGNGKTKTGQIWTYVRDDWPSGSNDAPAAWFAYSTNRAGEHPQAHLKGSKGHCKPKRSLATTRFMRPAPCAKRDAWRTLAVNSTICLLRARTK